MKEKVFITTDNIFADLGLKNADELRARSDLMSEVVSIIRNSGLSQKEIAEILGISAPKVSALMTCKTKGDLFPIRKSDTTLYYSKKFSLILKLLL